MDESGGEKDCVTQEVCNSMIAGGFNLLSSPYRIYKAFETAMVQGEDKYNVGSLNVTNCVKYIVQQNHIHRSLLAKMFTNP